MYPSKQGPCNPDQCQKRNVQMVSTFSKTAWVGNSNRTDQESKTHNTYHDDDDELFRFIGLQCTNMANNPISLREDGMRTW